MTRGLICWMVSQGNPKRSSTPGPKFSISTSEVFSSSVKISVPFVTWVLSVQHSHSPTALPGDMHRRSSCILPTVSLLLGPHLHGSLEGGNAWSFPLLPHLIHHVLDVLDVLLGDVGEAALLHEVFPHRHPLLARVVGI